jgi:CRP-like cAMP-binding protein
MRDITPSALRRILTLRQFPILRDADLEELTMFAENVTEVVLPASSVVAKAGSRLSALHMILAGEITTIDAQRRTWGPGQVFGGLEVLANRDASQTAMTTVTTTTLQLLAPDVTEILEDSFGVLLASLRGLAAAQATSQRRPRACMLPNRSGAGSLGFVERLMLLRQQLAFSGAPLESLVALAHASEEVVLPAGALVTRTGALETSSYVILEGALSATHPSGASRMLGPGETIGHLEALGSLPHEETIEVVEPMRALKVEAYRVFDIIEDHTDFGRAVLAALADDLLAGPSKIA